MTEVSKETSLTECNGDVSPEKEITEISDEVFTSDGLSKYHDTDVNPEDSFSEGNLDENKYSRASMICRDLAWSLEEDKHREEDFTVHKRIASLSLKETRAGEMTSEEGLQWEKIPPYGKVQETTRLKKSGTEKLLEERDGGIRGNEEFQVAEMEDNLEWLGSQQPRKDAMMTKQDKEVEDGEQEIDNDNEDGGDDDDDDDEEEDEVRLIEFKKGNGRASHFKEEGNVSEDSPLSSPNSQPITPEELPALGKKNDISRHTYSRYNTISYRKIKKGNTKQRIDEFESMLHL
ncbi:ermin [Monodelphis domestica]|uniref:Ermin n=1 Tax=Monodelphis domestica TaxID=13616 RepID=A0A5F8HDM9_MONDO|nr:ermin [Monodelphis domestica]